MARHPPPTSKPRWARRRAAPSPTAPNIARPKLSPEELEKLKKLMKERFKWNEDPRFFQFEGTRAQLEGTDMIIQAPTGSGKTAVAAGPHVWPASANKTTLMLCPLLALEDEMVETFRDDFGLSAVAVNSTGGKLTNELVQELVTGKYRIVLISPEMLQSPAFINRVLRKPDFARRIMSVVIDEAHCVSHWGAGFRKKYASLGIIRAFLPRGTPVIAVTATLTARVRRDLHRVLHFPRTGSRFINLGNDRSNVSIVVRACEHPQNSYADLDFIIPQSVSSPTDIPKTYLYVDDIRVGGEVIDHLNALLARRAPTLQDMGLIRPYNATLSHDYRRAAMKAFRGSPESASSPSTSNDDSDPDTPRCIRILVCTDAAGMGCNVGDVDLVVQWKLPKTLSSFVQRAGRAARSKSRTGLAVLLVERSAYSIDLRESTAPVPFEASASNTSHGQSKKSRSSQKGAAAPKGYAKDHGVDRGGSKRADSVAVNAEPPRLDLEAADEGLVTFVQAVTCRRKIWANVFESIAQAPVPGVPCCDICTPSLFDRCRPGIRTTSRKSKLPDRGYPDLQAYNRLDDWREEVFARDHGSSQLDASALLDDATIRSLTTVGSLSSSQVTELLAGSWIWWPRYGNELTAFIVNLTIQYRPLPKKTKKSKDTPAEQSEESPGACVPSKRTAAQAWEGTMPVVDGLDAATPSTKRLHVGHESASVSSSMQPLPAVEHAMRNGPDLSGNDTVPPVHWYSDSRTRTAPSPSLSSGLAYSFSAPSTPMRPAPSSHAFPPGSQLPADSSQYASSPSVPMQSSPFPYGMPPPGAYPPAPWPVPWPSPAPTTPMRACYTSVAPVTGYTHPTTPVHQYPPAPGPHSYSMAASAGMSSVPPDWPQQTASMHGSSNVNSRPGGYATGPGNPSYPHNDPRPPPTPAYQPNPAALAAPGALPYPSNPYLTPPSSQRSGQHAPQRQGYSAYPAPSQHSS